MENQVPEPTDPTIDANSEPANHAAARLIEIVNRLDRGFREFDIHLGNLVDAVDHVRQPTDRISVGDHVEVLDQCGSRATDISLIINQVEELNRLSLANSINVINLIEATLQTDPSLTGRRLLGSVVETLKDDIKATDPAGSDKNLTFDPTAEKDPSLRRTDSLVPAIQTVNGADQSTDLLDANFTDLVEGDPSLPQKSRSNS